MVYWWREVTALTRRILALLICLCIPACALGQAVDGQAQDALDALFARYDTLGASVAVIQNGQVTYTYCYGLRRIGGEAVTPDTAFQVGSISKMVSNIGLMQLLEGVSLDSDLSDLMGFPVRNPAYPNTPVTLRQLMTHTASLRDGGVYQDALYGKGRTLDSLFEKKARYAFYSGYEPGFHREYSNFGGGLIGSLIEKLSGQTVDDYMRANVFEPLGITAAYQPGLLSVPMASMYHMPQRRIAKDLDAAPTPVTSPDWRLHYTYTAGRLIISAPDLAKLLIVLCDGGVYQNTRILSEKAVGDITTRQDYIGSVACETGNGLFLNIITDNQVQGRTLYGHGGKAYGMLCAAYFDPGDRTGVVMLTNGCRNTSVHNGVGMLGRQALTLCYRLLLEGAHDVQDPFAVD